MGVTYVKEIMSPEELLSTYPLSEEHRKRKAQRDEEIAKVFTGESKTPYVIISAVWLRFRKKWQIKSSSFHGFIQINREQPVPAIKELYISPIRKKRLIC